ncbi:MAG TPA: SDR family oxidoreductase [Syntrophales bacterium]|nr:SDR family oxidoreductase [Syntrophales bacterium]HON23121.1 SDR family oxidoreductase [Syntrophales bacterium]HPC31466.1 SDR family oxidoreductase [Syntrophales bacterium]HQG35488.1 SDR family oxidoreductase [Syntrophales bacterium]HQJ29635.1 SDR family oxidoreductase [Syntrophales bacterium]
MKLFVTGALGHIGSRLIREATVSLPSPEIVMIDNLSTQRYPSLFDLPPGASYRFLEGDVLTADLPALMAGADAVIHLAAVTDAAGSFQMREKVEYVNFNTTRRVAESCVLLGLPMIHLSSTSVYGAATAVVDEDCPDDDLKPQSPYAETKLREERFLIDMAQRQGLRHITFRFGTIVGTAPGMRFHTAVNKFCWQAVFGQPLTVWRTALEQRRPYLDLADALKAIFFFLQRDIFDGRVYNVVTRNLTVAEIIDMIRTHIDDLVIDYVDSEIMNQLSYEVADNRIRARGFACDGDLGKSVAATIAMLRRAGGRS